MTEPSLAEPYLPIELSDVELAFPAYGLRLMPKIEDIPPFDHGWEQFANDWFGTGVDHVELMPSQFMVENNFGPEEAWRHLRGIMGSYEPKHEHKITAVAFLLSLWFRYCEWTPVGKSLTITAGSKDIPEGA